MNCTDVLKHEHQIIRLVLSAIEREMRLIQGGGPVPVEMVEQMIDFVQSFADGCHHAKEERLLFARLQERGLPADSGPIRMMLDEHDEGRRLVRAAAGALPGAAAGNRVAAAALADHLLAYAHLLADHIYKEDNLLFPAADSILTGDDQAELVAAFERVEAEEMGEGTHERYHELAHSWAS